MLMFPFPNRDQVLTPAQNAFTVRRGLSVVELMIATAIMSTIALSVAMLADTTYVSSEYADDLADVTQHGRVAIGRIEAALNAAHYSDDFPGYLVVKEGSSVDGMWYYHRDFLVVWRPDGTPANPDGVPLENELVFFLPDKTNPNELLEITFPSSTAALHKSLRCLIY